jgi:hypothetical protein
MRGEVGEEGEQRRGSLEAVHRLGKTQKPKLAGLVEETSEGFLILQQLQLLNTGVPIVVGLSLSCWRRDEVEPEMLISPFLFNMSTR